MTKTEFEATREGHEETPGQLRPCEFRNK